MYEPREKVIWFAVISRLGIIFLQFISNLVLPDHDAGVFISPVDADRETTSVLDRTVDYVLSGLFRWDSQYFIHIAKYGYTYENTLAFSPLYPIAVRCVAKILTIILPILNRHSLTMIVATLINFVCFIKSATIFFDLSKNVLKDTALAYKAAILYCVNPASIFFTAFYSEAMFAYLSFNVMLAYTEDNAFIYLPIALSTLVRSNGLINMGFPLYSLIRGVLKIVLPRVSKNFQNQPRESSLPYGCASILSAIAWFLNIVFLSIIPYVLLQLYNYSLFCLGNEMQMPIPVRDYGLEKGFLLAGTTNPPWCEDQIPTAYSYVQKKYWDVGLLQYYNVKQIPNFLLASPILFIILSHSLKYLNEHRVELYTLGSFSSIGKSKERFKYTAQSGDMFVFVIHGLFLTIFCILFVHIQVSTRLLCSASPLLYWYCASDISSKSESRNEHFRDIESPENCCSKWRVFLFFQKSYSKNDVLILSYFLGYLILGCILFPNFLPWT
ncbi:GPI mannosyltransferase 2 [Athalia rosae]|uniref:GPI mannosyltransferase 2 n=1 Tax=Athalia rosae TaxID=37344 RepID=UPI002034233C|nr:GPI mannosyltransferase 2 [Athalia rosae]